MNGDVESRDRLIGNNEFGLSRERSPNSNTLSLPARELMGVFANKVSRKTHVVHELGDVTVKVCSLTNTMQQQRLGERIVNCHAWVQ